MRLLPSDLVQLGDKLFFFCLQFRFDRPVLFRCELLDLLFALDEQSEGDGLHTAGRQAGLDRLPEQRAHLVTHQSIQNPTSLLRVNLAAVDRHRILHRTGYRVLRDLVEQHATHRCAIPDLVGHVPGYCLALPIRVGGQEHLSRTLGELLQLRQRLPLATDGDVLRREPVVDVDTKLPLGQISQVAHGGLHRVIPPKVFAYCSCFCR